MTTVGGRPALLMSLAVSPKTVDLADLPEEAMATDTAAVAAVVTVEGVAAMAATVTVGVTGMVAAIGMAVAVGDMTTETGVMTGVMTGTVIDDIRYAVHYHMESNSDRNPFTISQWKHSNLPPLSGM